MKADVALASSGTDPGTVQLWDTETARPTKAIKATLRGAAHLALTPDGKKLLIGDGGISPAATVWDLKADKIDRRIFGGHAGFYAAAFSADAKMFAVTPGEGGVRLTDTASGEGLGTGRSGEEGWNPKPGFARGLAFLPSGTHLFTGHKDGSVVVWEVRGVKPVFSFQAHTADGGIWSLAVSADGKRLMTATETGEVRFWDAEKVLKDAGGGK